MKNKGKKLLCALLACCLLLSLAACGGDNGGNDNGGSNSGDSAGGGTSVSDGSLDSSGGNDAVPPEGAIQIASAEDLLAFRDRVNAGEDGLNAVLTADIDLSSVCAEGLGDWVSIGHTDGEYVIYEGIFEGNGYTISGLYGVDHDRTVGLFTGLGSNGVIRNLTLADVSIDTEHGGAIAYDIEGCVENCRASGTVTGLQVGGLVCTVGETAVLSGCSFSGRVEGRSQAGGLAWQSSGRIEQCRNEADVFCMVAGSANSVQGEASGIVSIAWGSVTGCTNTGNVTGATAAGIAVQSEAVIEACINEGNVTGRGNAGGIGAVYTDEAAAINRCGNTGIVSGGVSAGGIAVNCRSIITNCFQRGTVCAGLNQINELFGTAGLDEFLYSELTLGLSNSSRAAGIVCYGIGAVNCYSQGSISVTPQKGVCDAFGLLGLLNADKPMVANCYTIAELSADDNVWGIGTVSTVESCYYSERTAEIPSRAGDLQPTGAAGFTDGTVTDALNQWVQNADGNYSAWKQGPDGPCFEWE
ncbi:MAG: hypothetical protein ACI3XJ_12495 [Oscillospiraceae bacterium]